MSQIGTRWNHSKPSNLKGLSAPLHGVLIETSSRWRGLAIVEEAPFGYGIFMQLILQEGILRTQDFLQVYSALHIHPMAASWRSASAIKFRYGRPLATGRGFAKDP
jgi:hypothetical protein